MILSWSEEQLAFMADASTYHADYYTALWQAISQTLPQMPQHICDAGCGTGYFSLELAKSCPRVTAVDLSQPATDLLRRNAAGYDNLCVKTGDIEAMPPEIPYDAMVFCYFGKTPNTLRIAKKQCKGTLVMVTRNYTHHRFALRPTAFDRDTVAYCRSVLEQAGIPYTLTPCELEFGQPFRSLDAAVRFFALYSGEQATKAEVLQRLEETDHPAFPYYLPKTKKMGIFTVQTNAIPQSFG